ncbi:unnamed protein product [Acanthoscelides obtectus]|uniref:HAT C-terminal dimerisation domain-containing protein n=1 Tax=Acanthoscelides obtectus TaxID=200917 RepID=A0A9P0Q7E9_ACAOB|nr:unnamed protein product [Acanthoscelides obtectus]CAK1631795.1 Zinc finger BED domain-containing protein 6 [Acanthoscelides obtectus]
MVSGSEAFRVATGWPAGSSSDTWKRSGAGKEGGLSFLSNTVMRTCNDKLIRNCFTGARIELNSFKKWHFGDVNDRASEKPITIGGTTGNLRKHLRIKHPTIVIDEETAIQKEEKQEWGISEKVVAIVTDNAANQVAAVKLGSWAHIPCFAHTLNLVVQNGLQEIKDIRHKVKAVVEYFHRSSQANSKLLSTQTRMDANSIPLKLKNDVSTRWNSSYYMFERFLKLEESLTITIGLLHNPVQLLSEEEWSILKEICQVLKPFEQITTEIRSETHVTVSKIIIIVRGLIAILKRFQSEMSFDITKRLIENLLASCLTRFDKCEYNSILAKPSILDPRFKIKAFSLEQAYKKAKDKLQDETVAIIRKNESVAAIDSDLDVTIIQSSEDDQSLNNLVWHEFDLSTSTIEKPSPLATAIAEIRMYLEEPNIPRTENTLLWWKSRELLYPTLAPLAKKYLSMVATSVPSERVFSKAGTEAAGLIRPSDTERPTDIPIDSNEAKTQGEMCTDRWRLKSFLLHSD